MLCMNAAKNVVSTVDQSKTRIASHFCSICFTTDCKTGGQGDRVTEDRSQNTEHSVKQQGRANHTIEQEI